MPSRALTLSVGCFLALILFAKFAFFPPAVSNGAKIGSSQLKSWKFDSGEHGKVHSLSSSQCSAAFPKLYSRLELTVSQRVRSGQLISFNDVRIPQGRCMLQVMIYDGELYVTDIGDHLECYVSNGRERIVATLSLIHQAIASSPEPLPNIEFPISYDDLPTRSTSGPVWGFTRKEEHENVWLMPDYGFWSWWAIGIPSFNSMSRSIESIDSTTSWKDKIPQAVWRGTPHYAPAVRQGLIDTTKHKSWADVKIVEMGKDEEHFLSLDNHCKYQYVFQAEGTSYSGRSKFLQLCKSVTVAHKLEWAEFASHLMVPSGPQQNYIEVQSDWSNLEETMQYFIKNPQKAEAIANRSHKVFAEQYLSPAAVSCYIRRLIVSWAEVQEFDPSLYEVDSRGKQATRGVPFEAFVVSFPQKRPGEYGRFAPE